MERIYRGIVNCGLSISLLVCWPYGNLTAQSRNAELNVTINQADGSYSVSAAGAAGPALQAGVAAKIDGRWVESKDYPHHAVKQSSGADDLGQAQEWTVTFSGLNGAPNLRYQLRHYADKPFADIQASVVNTTGKSINIEAIRPVAATGSPLLDLGGPVTADRILSDSFSEDRPGMEIHDFGTFSTTPQICIALWVANSSTTGRVERAFLWER